MGVTAMRKFAAGFWDVPAGGVLPALAVVSVCFFLGGLAGCVLAGHVGADAGESLSAYLTHYLQAAGSGALQEPSLPALIWSSLRWPALAILLGFTALGLLGLPILFAVRGFLLAFSISSFVRLFGRAGCLLAVLVFGITGAVAVPVLFVLGVQSLLAARVLAGRFWGDGKHPVPYGKRYFLRCGMCAAALGVCILLDYLAVPALVSGLAGTLVKV